MINSFLPSEINFVKKFANKKYPNKTEISPIDFDLHVELKKPKRKLLDLSIIPF